MHDVVVLILRYLRGTWRYRWWMLGVAWAICLVGWTIVARLPDQFEASARVYVDTSSVLRPYLAGLAINNTDTDKKIFLMTRSLLSRPNLEKVMRMTDLDLQATTDLEKDEIIEDLKKRLRFGGTSRENLYTIGFSDNSPELAKLVVKSLLTIFMESNLGEVRKDQDSAAQFLEQQMEEYDRRIRETESRLAQFKQQNMGLLADGDGGYYSRLREARESAEATRVQLTVAEERMESIRRQVEGEEPSFGLGPAPEADLSVDTRELDARITNMQSRLDDLLVRYTERHPDVISLKKSIADLKGERRAEVSRAEREYKKQLSAGGTPYNIDKNPVYQQMRLALNEVEADVSAKRRLLVEYENRVKELESSLDKVVALETEQRDLLQSLELLKRNHSELVTRLEQAQLGRRADSSAETVRFRVIDPPRVPTSPAGPNRVLLSSAVILAGLAVGFGLAFLMSQFRPTYDDRQSMNDDLGLPVLGSVNMVWTSEQVRARKSRNVSFAFSLTGLLLTFGIVLALYQFDIELLPRLAQSLNLT